MTPEDALEFLKSNTEGRIASIYVGCKREAIKALEKQIPKEPIRTSAIQQSCPNCGGTFTTAYVMLHNNCWHCGQALSFEGKEENNATP